MLRNSSLWEPSADILFRVCFFAAWAIFHTYQLTIHYYRSRIARTKNSPFRNFLALQCFCCCSKSSSKIPFDSITKILAISMAILGETVTGFKDGRFVHYGNLQHISMFSAFILLAIVEGMEFMKLPIPPKLGYATAFLAFAIEGILFSFHLHGRNSIDVTIHKLLIYVIFMCTVSVVCEAIAEKQVIAGYARDYFQLLQGVWFTTVGFILYNPLPGATEWNSESHDHHMIIVSLFSWMVMLSLLIQFGVGCLAYSAVSMRRSLRTKSMPMSPTHTSFKALDDEEKEFLFNDGHSASDEDIRNFAI